MFQQLIAFVQIQTSSQLQYLFLNEPILRLKEYVFNKPKYKEQCSLLHVISKFQCLEFIMRDCFIDTIFKVYESKQKLQLQQLTIPQIQQLFEVFGLMIKQNLKQYQKQIQIFWNQRIILRNYHAQQNGSQNNITLCLSCFYLYYKMSKQVFDQALKVLNQNGEPLPACISALEKISKQLQWPQCILLSQKKCFIDSNVYKLSDKYYCSYKIKYLKSTIQKLIKSLQNINTSLENKIIIKTILEENQSEYQKLWSKNPPGKMIERRDYKSQFLYLRPKFSLQRRISYHEAICYYMNIFAKADKFHKISFCNLCHILENQDKFKYFINDYTNKIQIVPILQEQVIMQERKKNQIQENQKNVIQEEKDKEENLKTIELTEISHIEISNTE